MRNLTPVVTMAALLAACSSSEAPLGTEPANPPPTFAITNTPGDGVANYEELEVCKYGSNASFGYSIYDRNLLATLTGGFNLSDGECLSVGRFDRLGADATVTETAAQSGFQLNRVEVTIITRSAAGTPIYTSRTEPGPSITEFLAGGLGGGPRGALLEFYNEGIPFGGEGCTPGYWKQPHHFDSWPAPYQPGDLFSAYFDDAFPGMTLLQVLSQGGGKLIALGRHTVAALLNGASSGVNYNLSDTDVINEFNAVFPGTDREYNAQKDRFAGFNEQGCPLN